MPAALIELQARQIPDEQPRIALAVLHHMHCIGLLRVFMGKPVNFVDHHRVSLLGHEQAFARRVIGQPLEPLVAVQAYAKAQLLGIVGVQEHRVVPQAHANQPLLALIGNHVTVGPYVFHRLRVAETGQRHPPQDTTVEG
ncbi:hypothetical protein D3C73_1014380 [compost metagenome]